MILLRISFLLGFSIIISSVIPSSATNNFVFGECSPGKDNCRDCYISLAQSLFQSDENVFNLSKAFFPPDTNTPEFVVVRYHFQNASYNDTKTWFWSASATYFLYPIATFQFLSLFFGKPEAFWTAEVDVTLNATECEGAKNEHLTMLTQRLRIYVEQYDIRPSIDDTYQAEAMNGAALDHLFTEKANQLVNIVICIQTLGVVVIFIGIIVVVACTIKSNSMGKKTSLIKEIKYKSAISKQTFLISISMNSFMFLLYAIAMDAAAIHYRNKTLFSDAKDELSHLAIKILPSLPFVALVFDFVALFIYVIAFTIALFYFCRKVESIKGCSVFTVIPSLLGPLLGLINHFPFIAMAYIIDSYYASSIFVYYMVIFFICFVAVHLTMRACLRSQLPTDQTESNICSKILGGVDKTRNATISRCLCPAESDDKNGKVIHDYACFLCPVATSFILLLFLLSIVVLVICYFVIIPLNGSVSGAPHQLIGFYQSVIIFLGIFITYKTILHKKHGSLKSAIKNRKEALKKDANTDTDWKDLPGDEKTTRFHEMVIDLVEYFYSKKVVDRATCTENPTGGGSNASNGTTDNNIIQDESGSESVVVPQGDARSGIAVPNENDSTTDNPTDVSQDDVPEDNLVTDHSRAAANLNATESGENTSSDQERVPLVRKL